MSGTNMGELRFRSGRRGRDESPLRTVYNLVNRLTET